MKLEISLPADFALSRIGIVLCRLGQRIGAKRRVIPPENVGFQFVSLRQPVLSSNQRCGGRRIFPRSCGISVDGCVARDGSFGGRDEHSFIFAVVCSRRLVFSTLSDRARQAASPNIARCSRQLIGMSVRTMRSTVRWRGCIPRRIAAVISGARNASATMWRT